MTISNSRLRLVRKCTHCGVATPGIPGSPAVAQALLRHCTCTSGAPLRSCCAAAPWQRSPACTHRPAAAGPVPFRHGSLPARTHDRQPRRERNGCPAGSGSALKPQGASLVVPIAVRDIAAGVGALLVLTSAISEIGTLIVPRPIGSWLTRLVDRLVNGMFRMATGGIADYRRRDRVLATQAAAILLAQLAAWLGIFFIGYSLLLWPFVPDITTAFTTAGPALWEIGSSHVSGAPEHAIQDIASLSGIITVTLQIAYL